MNTNRILIHQCCGPCSIYPIVKILESKLFTPVLFFYNPNIHPLQEFYKRLEGSIQVAKKLDVEYYFDEEYDVKFFINKVIDNIEERCSTCYELRLEETFIKAKELNIATVTSSILYSKMQKHDMVLKIGQEMSVKYGIDFYYEDFREGWQEGIDISKDMEIYRQNYCGCIFSEEERFKNQLKKKYKFEERV